MGVDKRVVEKQLQELGGFHKFFTTKEVRFLPEILAPGETVKGLSSGLYEGKTWVIVVTDMRILFLDRGLFFGIHQVDIPLAQVCAVSQKIGFFFGQIEVSTSNGKRTIARIPRRDVMKLSAVIAAVVHGEAPGLSATAVAPQAAAPTPDLASQLERLDALWQKGVLNEAEFDRAKTKLLEF